MLGGRGLNILIFLVVRVVMVLFIYVIFLLFILLFLFVWGFRLVIVMCGWLILKLWCRVVWVIKMVLVNRCVVKVCGILVRVMWMVVGIMCNLG